MLDSELEQFVRLLPAFMRSFGLLNGESTPCGQSMSPSSAHALTGLAELGALRQSELAAELGLSASATSRLVDDLAKREWAERGASDASVDGRVRLVSLTAQGERVAEGVERARVERLSRLLAAVPPSGRAEVIAGLALLVEAGRSDV